MNYQFGRSSYPGARRRQQQPPSSLGTGGCYGYGSPVSPMQTQCPGGRCNINCSPQRQPQQQKQQCCWSPQCQPRQQQPQQCSSSPRVSLMSPGSQPDPNMKVIKLNWGDLLGGAGSNGTQPLKVATVGANGDISQSSPGIKVTFNGDVPQGMPVHVMNINPYANILGGGPTSGNGRQ